MIISRKHQLVIYHIPKTGGVTRRKYFHDIIDKELVKDSHEMPSQLRARLPEVEDWRRIVFVRNPYDRMQSIYKHCQHYFGWARDRSYSFEQFVCELEVAGSPPADLLANGTVARFQHLYLGDEEADVLKMEDMATECGLIAAEIEMPVSPGFPHHHKSPNANCEWTAPAKAAFERVYWEDLERLGIWYASDNENTNQERKPE